MGYVIERVDEDGHARYTAMYRDFHGRRRSAGTFSTRDAADKASLRAEVRIGEGWIADPRRGRQTLRHYVTKEWFPNHVIEAKTRENYTYLLNRYVLPELGDVRIAEILPGHVRDWVRRLQEVHEARPPTIRAAKVLLDAVFTTALNDQVTVLHAGKGVKTPPVPKKPKTVITTEQFQQIYDQIDDPTMRLLVETDTETGLRWGELTELRVRDLDVATGIITVTRAVVELKAKGRPDGVRFLVKDYPKDREWRQVKIDTRLAQKLTKHIRDRSLSADDLLFAMPALATRRRRRPDVLPDLSTLGLTEPNEHGRRYRHGTTTAYGNGRCRCQYCRDAVAAYRASRRGRGKDQPRTPRTIDTDGHIPGIWFRKAIWYPALSAAHLGIHVRPHDLRHAHASWLLAGGADLQVVKERLGHASITTTEKYLHTLPGAHDSALAALAVARGRTNGIETSSPANALEIGDHAQGSRDDDLLELRSMVGKLSRMVAALSTP